MFHPVMKTHNGLAKIDSFRWEAREVDPHFTFRVRPWSARYLVIEIDADVDLDPVFYLDTGFGFHSDFEQAMPTTRHGAYIIRLQGRARLRRVRFDPHPTQAVFDLKVRSTVTLRAARRALGSAGRCAFVVGAQEQPHAVSLRRDIDPGAYFQAVVSLAGKHFQGPAAEISDVPLLSFVAPLYNSRPDHLDALVRSFVDQQATNWELLLCDDGSTDQATLAWFARRGRDPRIRVLHGDTNAGIARATNRGIFAAAGRWIALIDHDDALAPHAIGCLNQAIRSYPSAKFIYTDETITDASLRATGFFFKPAFDPVLLSGVNYINHLSVYDRDRLVDIGGLRPGFEGSQDYDLLLRYLAGVAEEDIVHVPYPAYLWRRHKASYSTLYAENAIVSARRALGEAYGHRAEEPPVDRALSPDLHRMRFDLRQQEWPMVSVIIPNRDSYRLIRRLLDDLSMRTDYPTLEIIVVDNGSTDPDVTRLYQTFNYGRIRFVTDIVVEPFNFARQINRGLKRASGDVFLLINNDIEIQEPNWLKEMVSCLAYDRAGIVGARLLYPSQALQHVGVIVGLGELAGHWYCNAPSASAGPMNRLSVRQSFSAVTGAAMLLTRACHEATGDFDEKLFAIAYNDIDYCLRASLAGFRTVWTPFATLIHHESASRGSDEIAENRARFEVEKGNLRLKYGTSKRADPAYSPWYSTMYSIPRQIVPRNLPPARTWYHNAILNASHERGE
ncbi:glycosyltransferase family 2 protein [Labrys okinawensis]|uniref:glycosyltransferase family 2 protein n=1 Tax=Labrys okinawensis TaxID=346911 RepID=UPI0039BCF6BE